MQWNILARALNNNDPTSATDASSFIYDWPNYRLWRTLQELTRFTPDLICLQEVDVYEEIRPYMSALGYGSIFQPKFASPCLEMQPNFGPDGCVIFYRLSMFQIQAQSCPTLKIDGKICSQVFIILQLRHLPTGKLITVVCLHLKSKEKFAKVREAQIKEILGCVGEFLTQKLGGLVAEHAVLISGDFNGEPFESFYDLVVGDSVVKGLRDAYTKKGEAKAPTTIKIRDGKWLRRGIDYVFFNERALEVAGLLELPENDEVIEEKGLPNEKFPSDHLSLVCDFKFLD